MRSAATVAVRKGPLSKPPPVRSPFDPRADRFEVRGELGRGGMGRVDDALDRTLDRPIAIKHLLDDSEVALARFAREVRITARLEHPGIVPVYEAGRDGDGHPYYVMRRVDGRPLANLVEGATFEARLALIPNVLAACDAVAYAHARGIVHRDLKPQNILVGAFGETLVIDWGLAREIDPDVANSGAGMPALDDALTVAGTVAGTPGFMAPEQARGEPVDARADVFALGATLFQVLAGRPPYGADSATEMVQRAGEGRAPDWQYFPSLVPEELRAIVVKAIAVSGEHRYGDAGELAADLRRFVTGNLVAAYRYGFRARLRRFARKHRGALAVAAIAIAALVVVGTISVRRVVAERDAANTARALAEARQRAAVEVADVSLIDHAQELARTDPLGAITLLRQLDPSSKHWRDAWLPAVAAWSRGIPFGFHGDPGVLWLTISPDNHHAVALNLHTGRVALLDFATRTQTNLDEIQGARLCVWLGEHDLMCANRKDELELVDLEKHTHRVLSVRGSPYQTASRTQAFIESDDHHVYRVGASGDPVEIAHDVEVINTAPDTAEILLRRGKTVEMWTPEGTLPVKTPNNETVRGADLKGDQLVAIADDEIWRLRKRDGAFVLDRTWPRGNVVMAMIAGDVVYGVGPEGLRLLDKTPTHSIAAGPILPTEHGFIAALVEGGLLVRDAEGAFRLGPFPTQLTSRLDISLDGRYIAALSDVGEILVWDIQHVRPRGIALGRNNVPLAFTPPLFWSMLPAAGVNVQHVGEKDVHEVMSGEMGPSNISIPRSGQFAMQLRKDGYLAIYDATRGKELAFKDIATAQTWAGGVIVARSDGEVGTWKPGSDSVDEVSKLEAAASELASDGKTIVAAVPGRLVRIDVATTQRTQAPFEPEAQLIEMTAGGRAWILDVTGKVWRWERGAAPVALSLGEPIDAALVCDGTRIYAHGAHSLYELGDGAPRTIPIEARYGEWMGDEYIAVLDPTGWVSLLDARLGKAASLPLASSENIVLAHDDHIVVGERVASSYERDADLAVVLDIAVPHDPEALRAWLRDVTNAIPLTGRASTWP